MFSINSGTYTIRSHVQPISRYMHGLVVVGGELYAVGGLHFIGPVRYTNRTLV